LNSKKIIDIILIMGKETKGEALTHSRHRDPHLCSKDDPLIGSWSTTTTLILGGLRLESDSVFQRTCPSIKAKVEIGQLKALGHVEISPGGKVGLVWVNNL